MKKSLQAQLDHINKPFTKKALMGAFAVAALMAGEAMAGTDTTFGSIYTTLKAWTTGSLGQVISLATFLVGLGAGIIQQSVIAVVVGVAAAISLYYAPNIIGSVLTALV